MTDIFRTGSKWLKVAIIALILGLILFVIGFATAAWTVYGSNSNTRGLWQAHVCVLGRCSTYTYGSVNDYHRAVQAMECLGLIGKSLAILTLFLYLCVNSCKRRDFLQATLIFTIAGIVFAAIGYAIIGSRSNQDNQMGYGGDTGWSMGVAIAGTVLYGLGGLMMIFELVF